MFSQDFQRQLLEAPLISDSIFLIIPESSHLTCLLNAERSTSILKNFADRTRTMTFSGRLVCVSSLLRFSILLCLFSLNSCDLKSGTIWEEFHLRHCLFRWTGRKFYCVFHMRGYEGLPLVLVK